MSNFQPTKATKFTFGLWTVGWRAWIRLATFIRPPLDPVEALPAGRARAAGVTFHDNDLIRSARSAGAAAADRSIPQGAHRNRHDHPMVTTTSFITRYSRTARSPRTTGYQAIRAGQDAAEYRPGCIAGCQDVSLLGRREGARRRGHRRTGGAGSLQEAIRQLCRYIREQGYDLRLGWSPSRTSRRATFFSRHGGHAAGVHHQLEFPDMVGLNPRSATRRWPG